MSGVEADPGACGCVKPGEVSGRWGHRGNCGCVNPGAKSGRVFTLETMNMWNRVYEGVHQGNCGHVTPGKRSDVDCEHGDCGHITPSAGNLLLFVYNVN